MGKIDSGISTGVVPDSKKGKFGNRHQCRIRKKTKLGNRHKCRIRKKNKIEKSAPCASYDKNANSAISWCRFEALPYSPDMKERTRGWQRKKSTKKINKINKNQKVHRKIRQGAKKSDKKINRGIQQEGAPGHHLHGF